MRPSATGLLPVRLRGELASDERLVARVRAGDARAFEAIYDRYERPIRSFCRHLVGQAEDADDAVQHTFLAAYRTITDGDRALDLRPWLFAVARNRCRSLLRGRRRDPIMLGETREPSTEGLAAAVERRESLRDLLRDIGELPEDQRAALILTQLETLNHDEVARVLEVPTEKVKALVYQARSSLISTRCARETACHEIREQLATESGPALRRGNLRRHLRQCAGCRGFQRALTRQRAAIGVVLPVAAQPALRSRLLGELVGGGSAAAAGGAGLASGGGGGVGAIVVKGAALKVAVALTAAAAGGEVAGMPNRLPLVPKSDMRSAAASVAVERFDVLPRPGHAAPPTIRVHPRTGASLPVELVPRGRDPHWAATPGAPPGGTELAPGAPPPATQPVEPAPGVVGDAPPPAQPLGKTIDWRGQADMPSAPPGQTKRPSTPPDQTRMPSTPPGHTNTPGAPLGQARERAVPPGHAKPHPEAPAAKPQRPEVPAGPGGPAPATRGNGAGDGGAKHAAPQGRIDCDPPAPPSARGGHGPPACAPGAVAGGKDGDGAAAGP